jgi:pyridoxal phosphate enzyme (YggS family)
MPPNSFGGNLTAPLPATYAAYDDGTMTIAENIAILRARVAAAAERAGRDPALVRLVGASAISKGVSDAAVLEALEAGLTDFGENWLQEAEDRIERLASHFDGRATWHFIGHVQRNKAPGVLKLFDIIHSVDSIRLAERLSERAEHPARVLLEVNVAGEASKYGFSPSEVAGAVATVATLPNIELAGLMTMAPQVAAAEDTRPVFRTLRELAAANGLQELSMGMTEDFEVAVEEGATMVRLGRAIFGASS